MFDYRPTCGICGAVTGDLYLHTAWHVESKHDVSEAAAIKLRESADFILKSAQETWEKTH